MIPGYQRLERHSSDQSPDASSPSHDDGGLVQEDASSRGIRSWIKDYLRRPCVIFKDIVLLSLAIPGLIALVSPSVASAGLDETASQSGAHSETTVTIETAPLGSCDCGDSVAEATAMGCVYDSLAAAWLPDHCRDDKLTADFERMGNSDSGSWKYYTDKKMTHEISVKDLGEKADDPRFVFYTTGKWHMAHCLFYWRKQYRARFNNVMVEPRYDSERHLIHCITVLLQPGALESTAVSGVKLKSDGL